MASHESAPFDFFDGEWSLSEFWVALGATVLFMMIPRPYNPLSVGASFEEWANKKITDLENGESIFQRKKNKKEAREAVRVTAKTA